jgi:peroxiredoxin (alkyl hydroperoxide reductase subunit C)
MKYLAPILVFVIFFNCVSYAQKGESQRIPLIGSTAPAFKAPTTNGMISFPKDFGTHWKILFAHPRDFTPVCSSEILELAYRQKEFKDLDAEIAIISVDKLVSHRSWKADLESIEFKGREKVQIEFPLIVDSSSVISYKYGMLDSKSDVGQSIRGVFFIDPQNTIRAFLFYPIEVGRNIDEIIRTLQALQARDRDKNIVLPANWQPGEDYMLPFLTPDDKEELKKPDSDIFYINWYMIYKKGNNGKK